VIYDDLGDAVLASKNGQFIRMTIKSIKRLGRDTQGVTLMKLRAGDKVSSLTVVRPEEKTETVNNESKIINQGKEKESKTKAVKPKIPDSEFRIQNSEKPKEKPKKVKPAVNVRKKKAIRDSYPPIVETSKIEKKKSDNKSHHSLLEKPDDVMPTIRAYDPKVDLEIKKTLKDDSLEKKRFDDVNWWGRQ